MIRASKIADQRRRLGRAVAYIEANYRRKLTLKELASVACLSLHHFLRLYVELIGETPMDTARRLRLSEIAEALAAGKLDIAAAARQSGYGSSQAFGRAFRRQFGVTPSMVRRGLAPEFLAWRQPPPPRVVDLDAQHAVGLRYRGAESQLPETLNLLATSVLAAGVPLRRLQLGWLQHSPAARGEGAPLDVELCLAGHPALLVGMKLAALTLPGGRHLHLRLVGEGGEGGTLAERAEHAARQLGVVLAAGPVRRVYGGDPMLTPRRDALSDFYLPLAA